MSNEYEFKQEEELLITRVSYKGLAIAIIILLASLSDFFLIFIDTTNFQLIRSGIYVLQDLLLVGVGLAFLFPLKNFRNTVKTSGKDIEEMIQGMRNMVIGFKIMLICLILTAVVGIIGIFV